MRTPRLHPALLAWLLASCLAAGAAAQEEDDEAPSWWAEHARLTAVFELEWAVETDTGSSQKAELAILPELELELSDNLELTAIARVRGDAFDELEPGVPGEPAVAGASGRWSVGDQAEVELRELYAVASLGRSFLTVGKQQIVWGKADGLKVLDLVNPQSFREFILDDFDSSRIPLWSALLEVPAGPLRIDVIWIPETTYHLFPEAGAAFEITSPLLVPPVPPEVPVTFLALDKPSSPFGDSDAGVRVAAFHRGWDVTGNYLYHYWDAPVFARSLQPGGPGAPPRAVVAPRYERVHTLGGTFANSLGDLTLRGELGYNLGRSFSTADLGDADGLVSSDELSVVVGFDWFGFRDTVLSLQLFDSWLPDHVPGLIRPEHLPQMSVLYRRDLRNETVVAELLWIQDLEIGDGVVRPKLTWEVSDRLRAWLGVDVFYGDREGIFGQFEDRSQVVSGIRVGL